MEVKITKYDKVINKFKNNILDLLGENLKGILLIGSYLSKRYIDNWSDIDLIIIVNEINSEVIEKIKAESNKYNTKIGITLYSLNDIKKRKIDSKTTYYFYLYNKKNLNYIYSKELKLPIINKQDMIDKTYNLLYNNLHVCKRNLLYKNKSKDLAKSQFKNIYSIIKTYLIINDIYPLNYEETFEKFNKHYGFEKFDYVKFIKNYRNNKVDYDYIDNYSINLINFIEKID